MPAVRLTIVVAVTVALLLPLRLSAQEPEYLSTEDAVGIGAASLALYGLGHLIKHSNFDHEPRWVKPPGFDEKISRFLGQQPGLGRQNILDSRFGSGVTVMGTQVMLGITDAAYPRYSKKKEIWQDQFLFLSGAVATKGLTDLFKGLVLRQRPLLYCAPELASQREPPDQPTDRFSFFSGHASSAFYSMTYLNKRIRSVMRHEMSRDEYRKYRWVSPVFTFGWAGYVAFSRIEAYRHYLTDVLAGALAGYLMGELYYSFNDEPEVRDDDAGSTMLFAISLRF